MGRVEGNNPRKESGQIMGTGSYSEPKAGFEEVARSDSSQVIRA
jgi:hypothetical protein